MVHRFLREMNFPPEAHSIASSLITKLGRRVQTVCAADKGLHYRLPMDRYLRGEVYAMAVVTITARLLFKLDEVYEVGLTLYTAASFYCKVYTLGTLPPQLCSHALYLCRALMGIGPLLPPEAKLGSASRIGDF